MKISLIGSFVRNKPFGTEIAFAKGLRQKGCEVVEWDPFVNDEPPKNWFINENFDYPKAIIVFKDHGKKTYKYLKELKKRKQAKIIEYQPDDIRAPGILNMMKHMRQFCDYAFTFDDRGAEVVKKECGYIKAQKLLVTADPDLYRPLENVEKDIDFVFVGNLSNPEMHKSRVKMINLLKKWKFNVVVINTFNVEEINLLYNRARVVLNHATDVGQNFGYGYGYQCRHFEAGFAGSCILTNEVIEDNGCGLKGFLRFSCADSLFEWANALINCTDDNFKIKKGNSCFELMKKYHTPEKRAEEIIGFIDSL